MVDKDLRHLIELLAAIERDERFVLSVTAVAEKTESVKYIAGFIEKNDIRDKQTVYEFIIPYYNRYLEKEESGNKIKKRKGDGNLRSYLYSMKIPSQAEERFWLYAEDGDPERKASQTKVYSSHYPFSFFTRFYECPVFEFEPITVFYGSNGSGKSTLLNVIAEKFELTRNAPYNKTDFFNDYCNLCEMEIREIPGESKIITSDDIFKKMNAVRSANLGINAHRTSVRDKRRDLQREITEDPENLRFKGMEFYDNWSEYFDAATQATSEYITKRVEKNIAAGSNGETAMKYLTEEIDKNALYLLDEPENSLAPKLQLELKQFIEESARFFGCQFIIATHSPLLLAMKGAKIYNLDDEDASVCKWTELENVRVYADFFKEHENEF